MSTVMCFDMNTSLENDRRGFSIPVFDSVIRLSLPNTEAIGKPLAHGLVLCAAGAIAGQ